MKTITIKLFIAILLFILFITAANSEDIFSSTIYNKIAPDNSKAILLSDKYNSNNSNFYFSKSLATEITNWKDYLYLEMDVYLDKPEFFDGKIRCYTGSEEFDLPVTIVKQNAGKWYNLKINLAPYKDSQKEHISSIAFYTQDKWLLGSGEYSLYIKDIKLSGKTGTDGMYDFNIPDLSNMINLDSASILDGNKVIKSNFTYNNTKEEFHFLPITFISTNLTNAKNLEIEYFLKNPNFFDGKLRCYINDKHIDLPFTITEDKANKWNKISYKLSDFMPEEDIKNISNIQFFTYDKWLIGNGEVDLYIKSVKTDIVPKTYNKEQGPYSIRILQEESYKIKDPNNKNSLLFEGSYNNKNENYYFTDTIPCAWLDFTNYNTLEMNLYFEGNTNFIDAKVRCYYDGGFFDLPFSLKGENKNKYNKVRLDLRPYTNKLQSIDRIYIYTYDKWLTDSGDFKIYINDVKITDNNGKGTWGNNKYLKPSYSTLPYSVWIEGESCKNTNFSPAEKRYQWIDGSLHNNACLDLAMAKLPKSGIYYAEYNFNIEEDGDYIFYYFGRKPEYFASPFKWSIDGGDKKRADGNTPMLDNRWNWKYCMLDCGTINLKKGSHTIRIEVDEQMVDRIPAGYSQIIDAIAFSNVNDKKFRVPTKEKETSYDNILWGQSTKAGFAGSINIKEKPRKLIEIKTNNSILGIDVNNGAIVNLSIKNKKVINPNKPIPFFYAKLINDKISYVTNWKYSVSGQNHILNGTSADYKVKLTITPNTTDFTIKAEITNTSNVNIDYVNLVNLNGIGVGDLNKTTWYIGAGERKAADMTTPASIVSPTFNFDWICISDDKNSFYVYIKEKQGMDSRAAFKNAKEAFGGELSLTKQPLIKKGETFVCPDVIIGANTGTWHISADKFSNWWHTWAKVPYTPEWLKTVGGMILGGEFYTPNAVENDKKLIKDTLDSVNIGLTHSGEWLNYQTECWYLDNYRLSPEKLNTIKDVVNGIHSVGGKQSLYTNGLMMSRITEDFQDWGYKSSAFSKNDYLYESEHTHRHHPMAIPCAFTRFKEEFIKAVTPVVKDGGIDLLYIDQIGAVPAHMCYKTDHGHKYPGMFTTGWGYFMKDVMSELQKYNKDIVTMNECPSPFIMQYTNLSLLGNSNRLRYIFPKYRTFEGTYGSVPGATGLTEVKNSFLDGALTLTDQGTINSFSDTEKAQVKEIITLKKAYGKEIFDSIYRDKLGLKTSENVEASVFKTTNGLIIAVINNTGKIGSVTITDYLINPNKVNKVELVKSNDVNNKIKTEFEKNNNEIKINIPIEVASLIFIN